MFAKFAIAFARCTFPPQLQQLLLLLQTRFSAVGVATLPSALNRRNAEMQLKRSRVAATRIAANGPVRRPLDAAYKHYYLAVRYGKQVLGAPMAPAASSPWPASLPIDGRFRGPAASNVFFENTQKAFK